MSTLVHRMILRRVEDVLLLRQFLASNCPAIWERGQAMQVVFSVHKATRSDAQNKFMWATLINPTAAQVWLGGRRFDPEVWNEQFKEQFLPEINAKGMSKWKYLPNGSRRLVMSTSDLNVDEMTAYIDELEAHVVSELGVDIPPNPRDWTQNVPPEPAALPHNPEEP